MIKINDPVYILSSASVVGAEEKNGPIGDMFDMYDGNGDTFGLDTWEKAESEMQRLAISKALSFAGMKDSDIDLLFAGDLLNQCVGSGYGTLDFNIPFIGLYGACSTCAEGLLLAALILCNRSSKIKRCLTITSSHNASAERQFRSPLEYGGQRSPTAQWTVTGSGAFLLTNDINDIYALRKKGETVPIIKSTEVGISLDAGITDISNMGAAMAPAAAETILRFLRSSNTRPEDYDLILTGDLGYEGSEILRDLLLSEHTDITKNHSDCGLIIYDRKLQDKHSGGSGCGCSAAVLSALTLKKIRYNEYKRILFIGTGALMNPLTLEQGLSIPGIAHLIEIEGVTL